VPDNRRGSLAAFMVNIGKCRQNPPGMQLCRSHGRRV